MNEYEEKIRKESVSLDMRDSNGNFLERLFIIPESKLIKLFAEEVKKE